MAADQLRPIGYGVEIDSSDAGVVLERMNQLGLKPELIESEHTRPGRWVDEVKTMKRHPDGRYRGNRSSIEVTNKILISRWVEREVIRLKRMGIATFETIADLLTRAGRGEYVPTVTLPEGVTFPVDYRISKMGCCKAYRRRLEGEPSLEAREHRRLDTERCEEMFFSLQPGIKKGDPKAIEAGVRVLTLKAKVIGYEAPTKIELLGNNTAPIPIALVREIIDRSEKDKDKQ